MILEAKNLGKNYRQGSSVIKVLQDCDLTVSAGESVAIAGPSGSGKSTLLSLLAGLDHPDTGHISVANQNLASLSENQLAVYRAKHIGIVFQRFHLMNHLSAAENIALPLELSRAAEVETRVASALEQVQLAHRAHHLPSQLSGGECQRVAIARALIVRPSIILADEPSGNLDDDTGEHVMNLLFDLVKQTNMALVLVTHNLVLAKRCSRLLRLQHGHLASGV